MALLRAISSGLKSLLRGGKLNQEMDEELSGYLNSSVEAKMRSGMNHADALREARVEIGSVDAVKQRVWSIGWESVIENIWNYVRYAIRSILRYPGFNAVAIIPLALGIGATTAIVTAAYATLLAPLPYPHSDRLVNIWSEFQGHRSGVSTGDFTEWKRQSTVFKDLNACGTDNFNIATQDRPEFLNGMEATPGYYGMLGIPLFLGRHFLPEEGTPGKERVVILTHRLWRHLGANLKIIGQTMQINGEPYTVVGVLASGTADRWDYQLIVPLVFNPQQLANHGPGYWLVTGRLKFGVTTKQAQSEMDAITAREVKDYPRSNQNLGVFVEPFRNNLLPNDRRATLWLLLGAVGFLLLIACLNVANLLLANGITRQREVGIRGALGAKPGAIFAQFLTESLVLASFGGILGIATGYAMLRGLVAALPPNSLPAEADLRINLPVLIFTFCTTTLAGVLFGYAPAWYASRLNPAQVLKEGGRGGTGAGRRRIRRLLVVAEFALALPLLAGAGLAIHSIWNLTHIDLGVRTDHILGFYLDSMSLSTNPKQTNLNSYYRRILASIEGLPGVLQTCAMTYLPLDIFHEETPFTIAGRTEDTDPSLRPSADLQAVTPDYFKTFDIRIVRGRAFTERDNESSIRVAMVNETFANRFLINLDPLQQRLMIEQVNPDENKKGSAVEWQIVGVFHSVKSRGSRENNPEIDIPFWQGGFPISAIGVHTAENPETMVKSIAAAVNTVDPLAALALTRTMEQVHDEALSNDRFTMTLLTGLAGLALLLAAVGIYGVMAQLVRHRTNEIGIRMALGANQASVLRMILWQGAKLVLAGLAIGLAAAFAVTRLMASLLYNVKPTDLDTFLLASAFLSVIALIASYVPARRASRVDPMVALRYE